MSKNNLKLQLEQLNFCVGDLDENYQKIIRSFKNACENEVDLVIFSELAITGYPPEDLLQKPYFISECQKKIQELCKITTGHKTAILLGYPVIISNQNNQKSLYNAAILIENSTEKIIYKTSLPNYGVFDEKRYFTASSNVNSLNFRGFNLAILICEDVWEIKNSQILINGNIDGILTINASPFEVNKIEARFEIVKEFIKNVNKPLIYVNQIGGQDALIFDGSSFAADKEGKIILSMAEFQEDSSIIELKKNGNISNLKTKTTTYVHDNNSRIYNAVILGIRDYIYKNGFSKVIIGMSGGIDSALVATMAVDALGSDNIKLVALPSRYNSNSSLKDATECSNNLGIKIDVISIEPMYETMINSLSDQFLNTKKDLTEENIQSRIRGNILMALSNKFGHLLLTTGNKSEMAVGYATIYGDMCGSFNPLKDIYKTKVFELAKWRNKNIPEISIYKKLNLIPENIISKPPSAELRDNQKDSDSLPEYEILDAILYNLIEEQKSVREIIHLEFDEQLVKKIARLFYNSEYKRRQAVIGPKISKMSFDKDRRYPITNKFQI